MEFCLKHRTKQGSDDRNRAQEPYVYFCKQIGSSPAPLEGDNSSRHIAFSSLTLNSQVQILAVDLCPLHEEVDGYAIIDLGYSAFQGSLDVH